FFDIQIRILDFERIECPLDELETTLHRLVALIELDPPAKTAVAVFLADGQHVRVQVGVPGTHARHGQRKSDHVGAVECPQHLAANFLCHHEQTQRHKLCICEVPDLFLQLDRSTQFFNALALSDFDGVCLHAWDFSSFFACCHKDSSSSMVACSALRPDS